MKTETSVIVGRPIEEIWNFMTDWTNYPKMNPRIHEARKKSTGPLGEGTIVEARVRGFVQIIRVVEYEPNRKLTLEHASGPSNGTITTFAMETNAEGKTRLTCTSDLKLSGFFKLIGPFVAGRARREVVTELSNVKRVLESEAQS